MKERFLDYAYAAMEVIFGLANVAMVIVGILVLAYAARRVTDLAFTF